MNNIFHKYLSSVGRYFKHVSTNQSSNTNNKKQNSAPNNNQGCGRGKKYSRKFYCWTHGLTGHSGDRCYTPAEGHQPNATLYNRMGGSNKNCPTNSNEWRCGTKGDICRNKINNINLSPSKIPPYSEHHITVKADSGASHHYWRPEDTPCLRNLTSTSSGPTVRLPDNSEILADKVGQINFPHSKLTLTGTKAHVLPHLRNCSLLSLGQLADDGCITVLEDHQIKIFKKKHYVAYLTISII